MRKIIPFVLQIIILNSACEKDDFCIQNPVTPKLILRFYDEVNRSSLKAVNELYVWAENKDSLFVNISTDSLVIPLNTNNNQIQPIDNHPGRWREFYNPS